MFKRLMTTHRTLFIWGVTICFAVIVYLLPPTIQTFVFWVIILIGLVILVVRLSNDMPQRINELKAYYELHRERLIKLSAATGILLMCASAWFYQPIYSITFYGFHLLILSLPFLWVGRSVFQFDAMTYDIDSTDEKTGIRWSALIVALFAFAVLMTINMPNEMKSDIHATLGLVDVTTYPQMALLAIGLGGLLLGFRGKLLPTIQWRRYHLILLVLVLLGGGIRAWNLEYTLHLFVDEFFFMNDVIDIREDTTQLFFPRTGSTSDVFPFFQSIFVSLLGPSLTSLRLVSPIISMIGLIAVYALARQFFTVRVALLSVFLVAVMPVYIQFGRIGMYMIVDPVLGILGFVYLIRAMRSQYVGDYALVGIMFGLTHYFYEGGRLFFTAFLVCWLIWMIVFGRRDTGFRHPNLKQIFVAVFCLLVVIAPIYHIQWQYDFPVAERFSATRSPSFILTDGIGEFLSSTEISYIGAPLHRYIHEVARDDFFLSDFAYVIPLIASFFLIGFGLLLFQLHRMRGSLLIWWVVGVAIGNTLIVDGLSAPNPRYIVVYAVLMIVTAVGIDRVWQAFDNSFKSYQQIITAGFIAYLGYVGVFQIDHYFNRTVPLYYDNVHVIRVEPAFDDMILRAVELPENTSLVVLTDSLFPKSHMVDVPRFFQRDDLTIYYVLVRELEDTFFETLPRDADYVFTFTRFHKEQVMDSIDDYFVISDIEGSPYGISQNTEMLFAYAPLSVNGDS